jgi:hypothetical protein
MRYDAAVGGWLGGSCSRHAVDHKTTPHAPADAKGCA